MPNIIKREVTISVNGNTASLSEPIYLYPRDRYIDIYFTIKDIGFKFSNVEGTYADNANYARVKYIRKDKKGKGVISPNPLEIIDNKVKLSINDDFMCKIVDGQHIEIEPGEYLLQILLYDSNIDGRVTIPPVTFEILEPIFPDPLDSNGEHADGEGNIFSIDENK